MRVVEAEPIVVGEREPLRPLLARLQSALDEVAAAADADLDVELQDDHRPADRDRTEARVPRGAKHRYHG